MPKISAKDKQTRATIRKPYVRPVKKTKKQTLKDRISKDTALLRNLKARERDGKGRFVPRPVKPKFDANFDKAISEIWIEEDMARIPHHYFEPGDFDRYARMRMQADADMVRAEKSREFPSNKK